MLHGRGMADRDTGELRRLWLEGLSSGARRINRDIPIDERDVRIVWYADVLDPRSAEGCDYSLADRRSRRDAAADPNLKAFVSVVGGFLGAATSLVADGEAAAQLRSLAADASFLTDARKRCASERRLSDAIARAAAEGRPVIVVAHSLGSLVAYDYLSALNDTAVVQRLVTVGSMVGSTDLRRLLIGGDDADTLAMPKSVVGWVNVRNDADPLAAPISVGSNVTTYTSPGETDPHEMVGYLRNAVTAATVLRGWCAAFAARASRGCSEYLRPAPSP